MSSSIDKRIVEMQFDNEKFKSGAKDTMKVLQDLDNNLNADRSGISKSLDFIADKFTVLGTMGRRAIENITDSLMGMGKSLVNDFFVAPRTQGFEEYELKMGSVQAIVNSVIKDFDSEADAVEYVSDKLDVLNKYADKTKYNFAQATASISKFTNAGVGLDDSVDAIQGILNLAASTGQGATQANSAMYNFAQALGSGYLGVRDWVSIENANMASMEFREELIKTAEAMGTLVKEGDKWVTTTTNARGQISDAFDAKKIRDSLQYQWVTTDVLTATLARYSDETTEVGKKATEAATRMYKFTETMDALKETVGSGWAKTWELIFGDFTESTNLWTAVYRSFNNILEEQGDSRNALLKIWHTSYGGAEQMQTAVQNILDGIAGFLGQIKEAWRSVFPPKTAEDLQKFGNTIVNLTERFKKAGTEGTFLKNVVTVLAKIVKVAVNIFKVAGAVVKGIVKVLSPVGKLLGVIFGKINGFLSGIFSSFSEEKGSVDLVTKITNGIAIAFDFLAKHLGNAVDWIINSMASTDDAIKFGKNIVSNIKKFFSNLVSSFSSSSASDIPKSISNIWKSIKDSISTGFTGLIDLIKNLASGMKEANFGTILDALNLGAIIALSIKIKSAITDFKDLIKTFKNISESLQDVLKNVSKVLGSVAKMFKAKANDLNATAFLKVAIGITILAAALAGLTFVDRESLEGVIGLMLLLAGAVAGILAIINKSTGSGKWFDQLAQGFNALSKSLSVAAIGVGLTGVMVSLLALAGVILLYNKIGWETFLNGFAKIGVAFVVLGGLLSAFASISKGCTGPILALGVAFITISASMIVFAGAVGLFTLLAKNGGWAGFGLLAASIGILVAVIGGAIFALSKLEDNQIRAITTGILRLSVALIAISAAVNLLAPALAMFTLIVKHGGWEGFGLLAATIGVVSGALIALAIAVKIMGESGQYFGKIAVGIGLLAASFAVIALFAPMIINNAADIKSALFILVNTICDVLIGCAPKIVEAIFKLITETLAVLEDAIPDIAIKLVHILSGLLAVLANYTPILTRLIYRIVKGMIATLFQLIKADAPDPRVIGGIILAVLGITSMIKMMASAKVNLKGAGATLLFMVILVGMVIGIFWAINKIGADSDTVAAQAIAIGILLVTMAEAMRNVSRIRTGGANFKTLFGSMIVFVVAAVLMMQSFRTIQDLDGWKMVPQAIAIGIVIAALGFAVGQAAKFKIKDIKQGIGAAISMLPFIGAMFAAILVFKQLEGVDPIAMIEQAIAIGLLMAAMGVAVMLANKSETDFKKSVGIAIELVAFLGVAIVLAIAFNKLREAGFRDSQGMIATAISMGIVIAAMGVAAMLANKSGTNFKKSAGIALELVALAVGLVAVAFALWLLKDTDPDKTVVNAIALAGLLVVLAGCVKILSTIKANQVGKAKDRAKLIGETMILFLGAGGAIWALSNFTKEGVNALTLITQAGGIALILLALAACVKILSTVDPSEAGKAEQRVKLIGETMILFLGAGGAIWALSNFTKEGVNALTLITQAGAVAVLLLALAACVKILGSIDPKDTGTAAERAKLIGEAIVLLIVSGGAVWALSQFSDQVEKPWSLVSVAASVAIILLALGACAWIMAAIAKVPLDPATAGVAAGVIGGVGIVLTAIIALIGAIALAIDESGIQDYAEWTTADIFNKGFEVIGSVIGKIGGNVVGGFQDAKAAWDKMKSEKLAEATNSLIDATVEPVEKLNGLDIAAFEKNAPRFTDAIEAFMKNMIDAISVEEAFAGSNVAVTADTIVGVADDIVSAAMRAKGTNADSVNQLAGLIEAFSTLGQSFNNSNDVREKLSSLMMPLAGYDSVFDALGAGVMAFYNNTRGMEGSVVDKAVAASGAVTSLSEAVKNMKTANKKQSDALTSMITNLPRLGVSVRDYCKAVQNIEIDKVKAGIEATKSIVEVYKALYNLSAVGLDPVGTALTYVLHDVSVKGKTVSDFQVVTQNLDDLGEHMGSLASSISVLSAEDVRTGLDNLLELFGFFKDISEGPYSGYWNVNELSTSLADLAENGVNAFVDRFKNASEEVRNAVREMIGAATGEARRASATGALDLSSMFDTTVLGEAFEGKLSGDALVDMIKSGDIDPDKLKSVLQGVLDNNGTGYTIGFDISADADPEQLAANVDRFFAKVGSQAKDGGYDVGKYLSYGISGGVESGTGVAAEAGEEVMNVVLQAMKKQAGIASPAKETYKFGVYLILGLINGVRDTIKHSNREMTGAMSSVLGTITSVFDNIENHEWKPSITPIMDLDNIQSGMQWMDGTLNRLGINTSFGYNKANNIASSMNGVTDNAKLAGEVSNLNNRLSELEATLANGDLNNGVQSISAEMSGLRDDIDSMMDAMTNLKVVMNGDTVVGQLIGRIDTALGKRARLAARK